MEYLKEIIGFIALVTVTLILKTAFEFAGLDMDGIMLFYVVAITYATGKEINERKKLKNKTNVNS